MTDDDPLRFKVVKTNSHDEVIARAINHVFLSNVEGDTAGVDEIALAPAE